MINKNYVMNVSNMIRESNDNELDKILVALKILRDIGLRPTGFYKFIGGPPNKLAGFGYLMRAFDSIPDGVPLPMDNLGGWHPEGEDYDYFIGPSFDANGEGSICYLNDDAYEEYNDGE